MNRKITRRDFLNGVAITIGASFLPSCSSKTPESQYWPEGKPGYDPSSLTGIRGNHDGSWEVMHAMRDNDFWQKQGKPSNTGEVYDLVIVGGGISGLSAAHYFQKKTGRNARILILDNHDDFGGHAKRNEFSTSGRTILGYGGTFSIDSPAPYSDVAKNLIQELGINVNHWNNVVDFTIYSSRGLRSSVFFDQNTFGTNRLVPFPPRDFGMANEDLEDKAASQKLWQRFFTEAPFSKTGIRDLRRLFTENSDYMHGFSSDEKKAKLARMSYADFLLNIAKVNPELLKLFQTLPHGLYGVGIDAIPAQDAWGLGFPGFDGMKLDPTFGKGMNRDAMEYSDAGDRYFFHFPDGGATIARLLVRGLIPGSIPGQDTNDIVTARCNYAKLDQSDSPTRIRLNSTVVRVQHLGGNASTAKQVEVLYVRGNKLQTVRANKCILACWNAAIPYICPELPEKQKEDLAYEVKVPLLYVNVVIENWNSFVKAGVHTILCPGEYYTTINLDLPVSIGKYKCSQNPDEPMVLHLTRTPCSPGLSARQQHRAGRLELVNTTFQMYENKIQEQLARILGPYGFDPARDIHAITVNRWAHGYAYQYNSLFDSFWLEGKQTPCERARKPYGRLAIANADAAAYSYTDAAIDQAYRAVNEVLALN